MWVDVFNENCPSFLVHRCRIRALIHGIVPTEWITNYMGGDKWWLVPIAAIIGIPLYIRLSTMIPISQVMIVKGIALGPVMALMISSAGASLPELKNFSSLNYFLILHLFSNSRQSILSVFQNNSFEFFQKQKNKNRSQHKDIPNGMNKSYVTKEVSLLHEQTINTPYLLISTNIQNLIFMVYYIQNNTKSFSEG